jgi:hypothetical protein
MKESKMDDMGSHGHEAHAGHGGHAHHGHSGGSALAVSARSTLHCLTGCIAGEVAGLLIGVSLGLQPWATIVLATLLSYVSGFTLGAVPVMRSQGTSLTGALRIIWIGEAVSIGVMEVVMNFVDWRMGGMGVNSVAEWMFWRGLIFAVPAGFLAAWPVNYWLIRSELKA